MINLNDFFDPIELEHPEDFYNTSKNAFGRNIYLNTPDTPIEEISDFNIAIIGVKEDRNSYNIGCSNAPDKIRNRLFQLFKIDKKLKIIDLGNLKTGKNYTDTYILLKEAVDEIIRNRVIVLIIGGSQDLTFPAFLGIENNFQKVNLVTIDADLNFFNKEGHFNNFLLKIFERNKLFNYVNLCNQQYLSDPESIKLIESKSFEYIRLGGLRDNIVSSEPIFRDADIISFDIGAIKQADSPGRINASPNGLTSEEACQLARFAGLSDKIECFGLYEMNPEYDINKQTASLAAQIIWHFIEGVSNRIKENPQMYNLSRQFKSFIVSHDNLEHSITFIKSELTGKWWMEVPELKTSKIQYISCTQEDYKNACNGDIPERWLKFFHKLN